MSASIPCTFLFLPSETLTCVIAFLTDLLSDKLIIRYLSLFNPVAADLLILFYFFNFTGRQGVCVVPVETPASGKSRLDPGCQLGG